MALIRFFFGNKCSCCNPCYRVEHRMVKLSKKLSGVTLKHDKFGIHLDGKGVTVDKDLELKNFDYAGCTLAKIWSGLLIDGYPIVAEFIDDDTPVI